VALADATTATEWGDWLPESPVPPALAAEVRRNMGVVPGWTRRLAPVPWVVRACSRLAKNVTAYAPLELLHPIVLVVSRDNSCRYCFGVQRTLMKTMGYADDYLDRLERDVELRELAPAQRAALDFARRLSRADPRPGARDLAQLAAAGYSRAAIAEIAYAAAAASVINRISTMVALPTDAMIARLDHPLTRLVRPLIARMLRPRRAKPLAAPPTDDGPCGAVVAALGDSPAAAAVRETIDAALASPVLPRRTKLLMMAVVARALGCGRSEAEARAMLATEGLDGAAVDDVLAHLGSPRLDAREALLVPFARESVRYRNGDIQARTRALHDALGVEAAIEAVGIASLANGVCRLSVLLDAC